jgi:hypothetical protein
MIIVQETAVLLSAGVCVIIILTNGVVITMIVLRAAIVKKPYKVIVEE